MANFTLPQLLHIAFYVFCVLVAVALIARLEKGGAK